MPTQLEPLKCEYHTNCTAPVTAKIGLPSGKAIWTCLKGFWEWRQEKGEVST